MRPGGWGARGAQRTHVDRGLLVPASPAKTHRTTQSRKGSFALRSSIWGHSNQIHRPSIQGLDSTSVLPTPLSGSLQPSPHPEPEFRTTLTTCQAPLGFQERTSPWRGVGGRQGVSSHFLLERYSTIDRGDGTQLCECTTKARSGHFE